MQDALMWCPCADPPRRAQVQGKLPEMAGAGLGEHQEHPSSGAGVFQPSLEYSAGVSVVLSRLISLTCHSFWHLHSLNLVQSQAPSITHFAI